MTNRRIRSFAAGVLISNSAPHLATAVSGRRHLTPLAGRDSGPVANGIWAGMNLAAGVLLLIGKRSGEPARWDGDLIAFEAGYLAFALWMTGSEAALRGNWEPASQNG